MSLFKKKYTVEAAMEMRNNAKAATEDLIQKKNLESFIEQSPRLEQLKSIYIHRQAIFQVAKDLEINISPFQNHDVDKYWLMLWMTEKDANLCHELTSEHHQYLDAQFLAEPILLEMMLDWESARFSRPDINRNAYDLMLGGMPDEVMPPMEALMPRYDLYHGTIERGINKKQYAKMIAEITPEILAKDICESMSL